MRFKHPALITEGDCARYAQIALEHESPDTRREAIVHLCKSRYRGHDTVVRALAAVAREDASRSVRLAATLGLGESGNTAAVEPLLEIVCATEERPSLSSAEDVRYAAMRGMDAFLVRGEVSEEQRGRCRNAALGLIGRNPARDVRIAAALLLRHYAERPVAQALIDALEQRDFGVVYESERSLMHLTGQRFHHDAAAWRGWLASANDPFAEAGKLDHELYPPQKNFWQQTRESAQRLFAGFGAQDARREARAATPGRTETAARQSEGGGDESLGLP